jgi:hypothetical protein
MNEYLLLILAVAAGSVIAALLKSKASKSVKILLTFSGAYLLSVGVFHLIPEIYAGSNNEMGLFIMGGFFLQLILEFFSMGMEHGHAHTELFKSKGVPVSIIISLFLHALLESMPVGIHAGHDHGNSFLWALMVHKLPVSIILYTMLSEVFQNKWKVGLYMLAFALIAPVGVFIGESIPLLADYSNELTAIVLGIFLHISTTILFEATQSHRFNFVKFLVTLIAAAVAWFGVA